MVTLKRIRGVGASRVARLLCCENNTVHTTLSCEEPIDKHLAVLDMRTDARSTVEEQMCCSCDQAADLTGIPLTSQRAKGKERLCCMAS